MDHCPDHRDNCKKITELCNSTSVHTSEIKRLEDWTRGINKALYIDDGSGQSIKSRVKGVEDSVTGIKELVIENRSVMNTKIDEMCENFQTGIDKSSGDTLRTIFWVFGTFVVIMIAVIGGMFSLLWTEVKDLRPQPVSHPAYHEPSTGLERNHAGLLENYTFTFVRQYDNKPIR